MRSTHYSILLIFLLAGCDSGPKVYEVSGVVTWDGVPLPTGEISLVPEEPGLAPDGATIVDGEFSLKAKPGKKKVVIRASRPMTNPPHGADLTNPPREDYIPARYNDRSTLSAKVGPDGTNDLKFELLSK